MNIPRTEATPSPLIPVRLTVVYDDHCQLCQRCRVWLQDAAQLVPLAFVAASDATGVRQLGLDASVLPVGDELIVVGHAAPGQPQPIWVGPDAFITCLWALKEHRQLARRLQKPAMQPMAKHAFHALSLGRGSISKILSTSGLEMPSECTDETCRPENVPPPFPAASNQAWNRTTTEAGPPPCGRL